MPIKFEIRIEEDADGVRTNFQTFDSIASPAEIRAGLSLKEMIAKWSMGAKSFEGWKRPNNEHNRADQ